MQANSIVMEEQFLTGTEVSELLNTSRAKAYRMMQANEIPVVRFGRSVRSPRRALMEYLRAQTQMPDAARTKE